MEESIYSRAVNKTGLGFLVVDEKAIARSFTAQQLNFTNLSWVQCDRCEKWRCLVSTNGIPYDGVENLPDKWFCEMNVDEDNNSCKHPEREQIWYENRVAALEASEPENRSLQMPETKPQTASETLDDPVLHHVLKVVTHQKRTKIISKNYMHDSLLDTTDSFTALQKIDIKVEATEKKAAQTSGTTPASANANQSSAVGSADPKCNGIPNRVSPPQAEAAAVLRPIVSEEAQKPSANQRAVSIQDCAETINLCDTDDE